MKPQRYDEIKEVLERHGTIADNAELVAALAADGVTVRDVELFLKADAKISRTVRGGIRAARGR